MPAERIIGVDFGTSTSVIRVKRYDESGKPMGNTLDTKEVIFGGIGAMVPTLIMKKNDDEEISYYGYDARMRKKNFVNFHSFKIALEAFEPEKKENARRLTEEFLCFLAKQYREQSDGGHLGESTDKEHTIISYPVKWSEETKDFMIEAAKKAGFPNVTGMDEAQAAIHAVTVQSVDYLKNKAILQNGVASNILLIDMGAGTTDLVLCRYTPGREEKIDILNTWPKDGNVLFGGKEIDSLLKNFFSEKLSEEEAKLIFGRVGVDKFKSWKEETVSPALSKNDVVNDFYDFDNCVEIMGIELEDYALDRHAFESFLKEYLGQFPALVNECIKNSGISGADVDLVIVTGGHSQWYFVQEMLAGRMTQFGVIDLPKIKEHPERIIPITRPQETVALGLVYSKIHSFTEEKVEEKVVAYQKQNSNEERLLDYFENIDAKQVIAPEFCEEDIYAKMAGNKYGFVDKHGNWIVQPQWDWVSDFSDGLCRVRNNEKYGYVDKRGELVLPCKWYWAGDFSEGLANVRAEKDGKYGYIDKQGQLVIPEQWYYASDFHEGLASVEAEFGEKYGFINKQGELVIPLVWEWTGAFSEGLAWVESHGKYGYIDTNGSLVIPFVWSNVGPFKNGVAHVEKGKILPKKYIIDKTGKIIG